MKVTLRSIDLCAPTQEYVLDGLPVLIGRSADAGVHLNDPRASRHHCEIVEISGTVVVRDLGSTNGTYVNGDCVKEVPLMPGHRLAIGGNCFLVSYERDESMLQANIEQEAVSQR